MIKPLETPNSLPADKRAELWRLAESVDYILIQGGAGGMIREFFADCVNGQVVRSLMPRKSKEKYYNKIDDFYIDSRVGFRGIREMELRLARLKSYFMGITKFRPRKFNLGDTIRIRKPATNNAWLRSNPQLWGKTAKVKKIAERSLSDPDYEGMYIQVGGKGNWIYVGSGDITKVVHRSK